VKIDGTTVRLVYLLRITDLGVDRAGVDDLLCKKTGKFWKISSDIGNRWWQAHLPITRADGGLLNGS